MKNKALDSIKYAFDINKLSSFFNNIVLIPFYVCVFDVRIKGLFTPVVQGSRKASGEYIRFFSSHFYHYLLYTLSV